MDIETTIKTETCSFSESKIYPGRGIKYASLDGRVNTFINHRCLAHATIRGVKNLKLRWCQAWRRANKKGIVIVSNKGIKKTKTKANTKAALGLDIDAIRKLAAAGK